MVTHWLSSHGLPSASSSRASAQTCRARRFTPRLKCRNLSWQYLMERSSIATVPLLYALCGLRSLRAMRHLMNFFMSRAKRFSVEGTNLYVTISSMEAPSLFSVYMYAWSDEVDTSCFLCTSVVTS